MQNCVISFSQTASDSYGGSARSALKLLNSYGLVVSDILYFSSLRTLKAFKTELKSVYDNIFIIGTQKFEASECFSVLFEDRQDTSSLYVLQDDIAVFYLPEQLEAMRELIKSLIVKVVANRSGEYFGKIVLKAFCEDQDKINSAVQEAQKLASNSLKIYTNNSFCDHSIEIIYNQNTPKFITDDVIRLFNTLLFEEIYSLDGKSLSETAFDLLTLKKLTLSVAESFTGGEIAKKIIENQGASKVFYEGITAYSNKSKQNRLGVDISTLNQYGAVSDQTAYEMAAGLFNENSCDAAISTTGIASPDPTTQKPNGLCFIAIGFQGEIEVFKYLFNGTRKQITKTAVNAALHLLIKKLKR